MCGLPALCSEKYETPLYGRAAPPNRRYRSRIRPSSTIRAYSPCDGVYIRLVYVWPPLTDGASIRISLLSTYTAGAASVLSSLEPRALPNLLRMVDPPTPHTNFPGLNVTQGVALWAALNVAHQSDRRAVCGSPFLTRMGRAAYISRIWLWRWPHGGFAQS